MDRPPRGVDVPACHQVPAHVVAHTPDSGRDLLLGALTDDGASSLSWQTFAFPVGYPLPCLSPKGLGQG